MSSTFLFVFLFFPHPPISAIECGTTLQRQSAQRRIVGGDEAGFGTFPWQVRCLTWAHHIARRWEFTHLSFLLFFVVD